MPGARKRHRHRARRLQRQLYALGGVAGVGRAASSTFGPAFLRSGMSALLIVCAQRRSSQPVQDRRHAGQHQDSARRRSDRQGEATGLQRAGCDADGPHRSGRPVRARAARRPAADPASFEGMLFHVEKTAEYYVESNGVESPTFKMDVLDLPTVDKLVLEYHFPAYTGLQPRTVDPGGDIAAIKGTEVHLKITPTMATPGGRVVAERERVGCRSRRKPTARSPATSR